MLGILAGQDATGYGVGATLTASGVLLALRIGWLVLPGEVEAWRSRAVKAEDQAAAERLKVDALNEVTREQVIPAVVSMTAATVEATRELRRNRTKETAGSAPARRGAAR